MTFDAVILAGGKSTRMGRDKAMLEVDGQPLLARQIQLARDAGAQEVFISGRADADYAAFDCTVLKDRIDNVGPLAGIEAALAATTAPLLLVLAVDMPRMNADLLRRLALPCSAEMGAIPRVNGQIEPLAAFYPKAALKWLDALHRTAAVPSRSGVALQDAFNLPESDLLRSAAAEDSRGPVHETGERLVKPSAKAFAELCVAHGLAKFLELPTTDAHLFSNWNSPADLPCTT